MYATLDSLLKECHSNSYFGIHSAHKWHNMKKLGYQIFFFSLYSFQSVYPPKLSAGSPRRHHAVIYVHVKLEQPYTAEHTTSLLKPDPREVMAFTWLNRQTIQVGWFTVTKQFKLSMPHIMTLTRESHLCPYIIQILEATYRVTLLLLERIVQYLHLSSRFVFGPDLG